MTDFKFKIDLENQSIIPETPKKETKKKKKDPSKTGGEKSRKKKPADHNTEPRSEPTAKKKKKKKEAPQNVETEKKKINSNSIISLTLLPNNESANKLDQVQKLSLITKKKPRHWEKRWVLMQNVYEFTKEIWIKKWVLVDGGEDISDNNNYLQTYYSNSKTYKEGLPKKYQCSFDECRKIFTDSSSLRKHLLTHGERHYICKHEECGKKFLDNSKLRRHQLVHTGEKPFKCDLCGKKFSLDFNLKTHLRTHTGEKPYICSYSGCDKRFTQSSNLTAHEKTHKEMEKKEASSAGNVGSERKEGKLIFALKQDESALSIGSIENNSEN